MVSFQIAFSVLALLCANSGKVVLTSGEISIKNSEINYRLPNHTHPVSYDISLATRIDLGIFDFSGTVKIGIVVDQPTREIVLHASQLTIANVSLARIDGNATIAVITLPPEFDADVEFVKVKTENVDFSVGDQLILEIGYNGILRTNVDGFFRTSYQSFDGTQIWLASTQFMPTNARHAFPCYDEPALKAKFTIRITHGKRFNAISNMQETRVEHDDDDTVTTSFLETPPMSAHRIAFVVSDFPTRTNTNNPNAFRHRIYARPSAIHMTRFGLRDSELLFHEMESYLGVNLTLPKMDQIAVPGFGSKATASWGLVTYNEDYLLHDEEIHDFRRQMNVRRAIAREFSHQWFGSLVTPKWWNGLFLIEAFADLFQQIGIALVYPDWNIWQYYITHTTHKALKIHSTPNSRPMTFYVESPAAIADLFGQIANSNWGIVLRMCMHAFAESTFMRGVKHYLTEHSFKSTDANDLFDSLEKVVREDRTLDINFNVHDIFSSWLNQTGYPLLIVHRTYDIDNGLIVLKQKPYTTSSSDTNDTNASASWWIPFNYATPRKLDFNNTRADGWFSPGTASLTLLVSVIPSEWMIFNKQQTSFYRVLYDDTNWKLLANELDSENYNVIHVLNRAQILDDLNEFVSNGMVNVTIFLDVLSYLKRETEYAPWAAAQPGLLRLNRLFSGNRHHELFRGMAANLTERFFESVGLDDVPEESILRKYSREIATNLACEFGLSSCLKATHDKLSEILMSEDIEFPINTKSIILSNGIRNAVPDELEILWELFLSSDDLNERKLLLESFGRIADYVLLGQYLNRTLMGAPIDQNGEVWRLDLFHAVLRNGEHGIRACIQLLWNYAAEVRKSYGLDNLNILVSDISEVVSGAIIQIEFDNLLNRLVSQQFIESSAVSTARINVRTINEWNEKWAKHVDRWFGLVDENRPSKEPSSAYVAYSSVVFTLLTFSLTVFQYFQ